MMLFLQGESTQNQQQQQQQQQQNKVTRKQRNKATRQQGSNGKHRKTLPFQSLGAPFMIEAWTSPSVGTTLFGAQ